MKLRIEYALFQANVSSPGFLSPTISLARTETKHQEVEMEYDTTDAFLLVKMSKLAKPIIVPSTNIKSMIATEIPLTVKK